MWSLHVVLAGIVYAATLTLFVLSTKLTTAANAIFLQATAPLYLLLLGPLLLSEHFKRRDVIYLLAVALGMFSCFMGRPDATVTAPDPGRGNLLALMCSITWALTLVALRYVERDHSRPGLGMSAWQQAICSHRLRHSRSHCHCRRRRQGSGSRSCTWCVSDRPRICMSDRRDPPSAGSRRVPAPSGRTGPQSSVDLDPAGRVAGLMDDRGRRDHPGGHSAAQPYDHARHGSSPSETRGARRAPRSQRDVVPRQRSRGNKRLRPVSNDVPPTITGAHAYRRSCCG